LAAASVRLARTSSLAWIRPATVSASEVAIGTVVAGLGKWVARPEHAACSHGETTGQQVAGSPDQPSAHPDHGFVTWEDAATIPSDALSARQKGQVRKGTSKAHRRGERAFRGWTPLPRRGIQRVPIPDCAR
jgi:hypothetical protein